MQKTFNFFYAFLLALLGFGVTLMAQEEITLTTYYPAPYGAYAELTTTGNTYLATDSAGNVGIGTISASNKLEITGTVNATAYSVGATAGAATTTITYVKTVNFVAQTVTTGTITVVNGIVTAIN